MPKHKTRRKIDGWLVIDKPLEFSSADIVNKIRWQLNAEKAGHAGTLDPFATGMLVIGLGEATKAIPYITDALKTYVFEVRWGEATSTDDQEGEVIARSPLRPDEPSILAALDRFRGDIQQVPPKFSAIKVNGERAYTLARKGEDVELEPRSLWVEALELSDVLDIDHARFVLTCGKGGYVRSIARDLGEALGTKAHVTSLRRIASAGFGEADMISYAPFNVKERANDLDIYVLPLEKGLSHMPNIECPEHQFAILSNGNPIPLDYSTQEDEPCYITKDGLALGLGICRDGWFHPKRMFNR